MRLDVFLSPGEVALGNTMGRVVAVTDILRASTTIAVALANGARRVVPVENTEEAITRAKGLRAKRCHTGGGAEDASDSGFRCRKFARLIPF